MKKINTMIVLILLILAGARYYSVNAHYPSPKVKTYTKGETLELGNYRFTLKKWEWHNGEIYHELMPGYVWLIENGKSYPSEKERVGIATVTIEKWKDDDTFLDLTNITFESKAWGNQWDHEFFMGINQDLEGLRLEMKAGESRDILFPIATGEIQFPQKEWDMIDQRDFYIVIDYYPVKYQLLCE